MPGPKTKDWTARENAHKPKGLHVIVAGQVELEAKQAPSLTERTGRPKMLELELTVGQSKDEPIKGKVWKQATFHKEVKANQYNSVRIMWEDFIVADIPVVDDREQARHLVALTASANAKVASKPAAKKPAPKKPAKKAAASKKKTPKAVGGWAKGKKAKKPAKKAAKPKKAAKKVAKKAAKKSKRR